MRRLLAVLGASVLSASACAHADGPAPPAEQKPVVQQPANEARQLTTPDATALAEFNQRVTQYAEMHKRLEATLPKLPKETTPEAINAHQRALEKLIRAERKAAKQGDLITPATRRVFRQLLARVFSGPEGRELKGTILDENPGNIGLTVNARYPDQIPLSTVPPQVLASLPKLPEDLEYRFIGERLILLDVHAHTIADFMDNAFPA
ncbi:MAG TPA: hypothetical protein VJ813_04300 [Vicinamibacterales bacterium]|nr:hypothetical protein [Vicinamibacterales bacterium]